MGHLGDVLSAWCAGIKRVCMTMHAVPPNVPIPINVPPRISTQNIITAPCCSGGVAIWVAYFRFRGRHAPSVFSSVLFFSRPRSDGWPHHRRTFLHLSLSSVILIDSSTESPVHVLMLSIQAVCGLPRLRAPDIDIACIISLSRQLPCFFMV